MSWKCFFFHKWKIYKITRPLLNYSDFYYTCTRCGETQSKQIHGKWIIDEKGNAMKIGIKKVEK